MLKNIYRNVRDEEYKVEEKAKKGSWVYAEEPTGEEIKKLEEDHNLDEGHLRDALDIQEVPRLEVEDGVAYIFTRIPHDGVKNLYTTPLLIIMGKDNLFTVARKEYEVFDKFMDGKMDFFTTQKTKFFIQIFREINNKYNIAITQISRKIYNSTAQTDKVENRQIVELVNYEQALNDYLNALLRNSTILNTLLSGKILALYEEDRELVEDLFLATEQLVVLAKNSLQTVRNIRDAYSVIVTNNLNRVIKLLTSLTIILTVPTMIASFFGMNVDLPIVQGQIGFWLIAGSAFLISVMLFIVFVRNDWM